jgi:hypothetical protein
VCGAIRHKHYPHIADKTYACWAGWFVVYHDMRHLPETAQEEVSESLTYLAGMNHLDA